jgi:putative transposase
MPDSLYLDDRGVPPPSLDPSFLRLFNSPMVQKKDWPHAPIHRLDSYGVYMVTGATLRKAHLFSTDKKLDMLEDHLLKLAKQYHWQLEAWAAFVNHYHFVARGHPEALPLDAFLNQLHSDTARNLNLLDQSAGREVWYNFWDTKLTYERSYLARLNYVHQNAVKHGLVNIANQYPWCSAAWFERTASVSAVKTIYSFKTDKLKIHDDY